MMMICTLPCGLFMKIKLVLFAKFLEEVPPDARNVFQLLKLLKLSVEFSVLVNQEGSLGTYSW